MNADAPPPARRLDETAAPAAPASPAQTALSEIPNVTRPSELPFPILGSPDPVDRALSPLMAPGLAQAWGEGEPPAPVGLRTRLLRRIGASRTEMQAMVTTRLAQAPAEALAGGVSARALYTADPQRPLRAGEPRRARLLELQAGATWQPGVAACHREWLVMRGAVRFDGDRLADRDYRIEPAGSPAAVLSADEPTWLFLRESDQPAETGQPVRTVRDAEAGWPEFAPGIRRRVLWHQGSQAALLYCAQAGAQVPKHRHGHDEECLMVQGELFLDDLLLRTGDYQLAPVGTGHRVTETDTGVVIYAHGDLDLQFIA